MKAGMPAVIVALMAVAACGDSMRDQPRYDPLSAAQGWPHNQSARVPPEGTVARDDSMAPDPQSPPTALSRAQLERGRERYGIFCSPCHGGSGHGDGMVVQRGFPAPPSLHSERLRAAPLRHYYDVISGGIGRMYAYGARVPPQDRWAIAVYIRALQLSQHATVDDLAPGERKALEKQP
ncbi:c-type cytochrome [Microbulbifer yueqingensis]|uniref:Cytochrome C oxidase, cbb3-type, subunit III n=1 Tax=Microbulbifer yueqingensis TaxID=658219 RepID=A0A1G9BAF3_9GAMM|nr:cytochrome c [Microbulbifer yueqingensis]SDK36566.1 Cytochrome C oxidase, cbb3-type, subunit III [Microbulbifer yueqingensis]